MGVTAESPEDLPTRLRRAASAGNGPDLFAYAHDQVGEWTGGGLLRRITPSARVVRSKSQHLSVWGNACFTIGRTHTDGQEPSLTIDGSMATQQHHRHWSGSGFKGFAGLDQVRAQNASVPLYKLTRQRETRTHD